MRIGAVGLVVLVLGVAALGLPGVARAQTAGVAAEGVPRTVAGVLRAARDRGQITEGDYRWWLAVYKDARATRDRLGGRCRVQLRNVLVGLERYARQGLLTPSRMRGLFIQLAVNARYWEKEPRIAASGRVTPRGSALIFEHFAGKGLQFHPLGTFGRLNARANACLGYYGDDVACPREELRAALDEVASIAVLRGGSLTWEYGFFYAGGTPPWVSSMAQATGLQAFAKGADVLSERRYMDVAVAGLPLFAMAPPLGVRVPARGGSAYLHYSFAPRTWILNAWLQTLIGLQEVARRSGDERAVAAFKKGDAALRRILRRFDTGRWSRYELGGPEASYSYHQLVVDFLGVLCSSTERRAYCTYQRRFARYLRARPKPRPPSGGGGRKPVCGVV